MKKIFFTLILAAVVFTSCQTMEEQKAIDRKDAHFKGDGTKNIADNTTYLQQIDSNGNKLKMYFDDQKETVTILFKNDMSVLDRQVTASGYCYKNSIYELIGKVNDIQLKKNGKIIFEREDNIVRIEAKSKKGDILNLTFNNDLGTVKVYFNGGAEINMKEQKPASGIWYKNDTYELLGKGNHYTLKKNASVIFEN